MYLPTRQKCFTWNSNTTSINYFSFLGFQLMITMIIRPSINQSYLSRISMSKALLRHELGKATKFERKM